MGLFTSQMQLQLRPEMQIRMQIQIRRQILIPDTFNVRNCSKTKSETSSISSSASASSSLSSCCSSSPGRKHHPLADKSLTAAHSQTNRRTTIGYIKVAPPTRDHMKRELHKAHIVARGKAWGMGQAEAATMKAMNE